MNLLTAKIVFLVILSILLERSTTHARVTVQVIPTVYQSPLLRYRLRPATVPPLESEGGNTIMTTQPNMYINKKAAINNFLAVKCVIPVPCPKILCKEGFTPIPDTTGCTCPRCVCTLPCPACPTGYVAINRDRS